MDVAEHKLNLFYQIDIRRVELHKPFMILNACTKDLKPDVKKSIDSSAITCIHKFNTAHPFSWFGYRSCKEW